MRGKWDCYLPLFGRQSAENDPESHNAHMHMHTHTQVLKQQFHMNGKKETPNAVMRFSPFYPKSNLWDPYFLFAYMSTDLCTIIRWKMNEGRSIVYEDLLLLLH